jgi:hypothetical protein
MYGLGNWTTIARDISGRNPKQCRERWLNQLCPSLNKDRWTPQEDAILVHQQRIFGNVWSKVTQFLPGRSPNSIKNRWFWLTRHKVAPYYPLKVDPYVMRRPPVPKRLDAPALGSAGPVPSADSDPGPVNLFNQSVELDEDDGSDLLQKSDTWSLPIYGS